jgi:16S rRNA (cytidine1402-2'-O)-methyltransferase
VRIIVANSAAGRLYVVATPIGNLGDLSPRAARDAADLRLIAAEDTRHTGALLHHFGIPRR